MTSDELVDEYAGTVSGAHTAYQHDWQFHAEFTLLRRMLRMTEAALINEGMDREACTRVLRTVLYGTADPDAGLARIRAHEERSFAERLAAMPPLPEAVRKLFPHAP